MAGEVTFIDNISVEAGGNKVLNSLITKFIDQSNIKQEVEDVLGTLGYKKQMAYSLDETFTTKSGDVELDELGEGENKNEIPTGKTPNKGYKIKEYGGKKTTTYLMKKWIMATETLKGADSNVKIAFNKFYNDGKSLINGAKRNIRIDAIKVLTEGFAVTSDFGPGSPTPKGVSLFNTSHTVNNGYTTKTFRNILATPNQALSADTLQEMLNIHKTELLLDNGFRVPQPKTYKLVVGRKLAVEARILLNTPGSQAGIYSGDNTNTNANVRNVFSFNGNMVEILDLDMLGETTKRGVSIGLDTMYFLMNKELLNEMEGLRFISLYEPVVKVYENDDNDNLITDARLGYAVDHYGAECAITGSKGTV